MNESGSDIAIFVIDNNAESQLLTDKKKFNDLTKIWPFYKNDENGLCNALIDREYSFTLLEISENEKLKNLLQTELDA